jgi:hypothetical protein
LGGITIYGGILNNSNLDIYRNDPTIKYLQPMEEQLDEIYGKENFQNRSYINTFKFDLYDKNTYSNGIDPPTTTIDGLDQIITHKENIFPIFTHVPLETYDNVWGTNENNYENTGLGILFIFITMIIYKYF